MLCLKLKPRLNVTLTNTLRKFDSYYCYNKLLEAKNLEQIQLRMESLHSTMSTAICATVRYQQNSLKTPTFFACFYLGRIRKSKCQQSELAAVTINFRSPTSGQTKFCPKTNITNRQKTSDII